MIRTETSQFSAQFNQDTQNFIRHLDFFIYESSYNEFKEDFRRRHRRRERQNPNTLYYFLEGGGRICFEDGREVEMKAGDIWYHPIFPEQSYTSYFSAGTKKLVVHFFVNFFTCEDLFSEFTGPICLEDSYHLMPKIREAIVSDSASKQLLLTPLVKLSIEPLFEALEEKMRDLLLKNKKYSPIFEYIHENLYIDLTMEKISKNTGFSVYVLSHGFVYEAGFTVKKYLQNNILKMVCHDLSYTELRMTDIAMKYHFSTESYFSRWFYKLYHCYPTEYRRLFQQRKRNFHFY